MTGAESYERLGAFYLGRVCDPESGEPGAEPLLYDARDLTTHAVCVGMTGSGKTGLGIVLLEEAAIDGIPAIAIDPKGDLGNLLLAFPELRPEDFAPWIDPAEAARERLSAQELAARTAERWRDGLARSGQDGARIARFRDAVDATIYTPGSRAGTPLAVLRSFAAPPAVVAADEDALRERLLATVSGLLALAGVGADPLRGREAILLARILEEAWRAGRDLDLPGLVRAIQSPPFERVGALDIESFYPSGERFALASGLNNLLASPGFGGFLEGDPLDVGRLLYTPEGRPRLSILSIAHLTEPERMFFVTLLLSEVVAWVRAQPGTQSLRAILYMDEVFGYVPPVANPPSKGPLLTLMKQARAQGLGVVLATQNPVDLDYKGLANAGTWFLGRLQTERDKARVLDGLEGAQASAGPGFDRARVDRWLSGLGSRTFLLHDVHEDAPALFQTRFALSYLRGPMTREDVRRLSERRAGRAPQAASLPRATPAPMPAGGRPVLDPAIGEGFLPATRGVAPGARCVYRPQLLGVASLRYVDAGAGIDVWETAALLAEPPADTTTSPWEGATRLAGRGPAVAAEPLAGAGFAALPATATRGASYDQWGKLLGRHLLRERPLRLFRCPALRAASRPGESEGEFRIRLHGLAQEQRDAAVDALRRRFAPRLASLAERVRRAEQRVEREGEQYRSRRTETAISVGATLLGALLGRRLRNVGHLGRATTAARGAGRMAREREDVARAEEDVVALRRQLAELEAEFEREADALRAGQDLALDELRVPPRRSDLAVERVRLVWRPFQVGADGVLEPV